MNVSKAKSLLAIILLPILLLTACVSQKSSLEETTEPVVPLLTVHSGGKSINADEHFSSALTFSTHGWLAADGASADYVLPTIASGLPEITMEDDFSLEYKDNCTFISVTIYNESYNRVHTDIIQPEDLKSLQAGSYYVSIKVRCQGAYIESEKKYENSVYHCIFKLIVE